MSQPKSDVAALVDRMAELLKLPIAPGQRDAVIVNFERSMNIAAAFADLPLDDDLVAAPVFRP